MIAPVCRRLRSSPYAHLRRAHSPLLLPRFMSGCAAHAEARSMVTATVAAGLGFSVASLPQCRRGGVVGFDQVRCAASLKAAARLCPPKVSFRGVCWSISVLTGFLFNIYFHLIINFYFMRYDIAYVVPINISGIADNLDYCYFSRPTWAKLDC